MRKIKPLLQTFLFTALVTFSLVANAVDPNVTVRVRQSDGTTAISGALTYYYYLGSWHYIGNTDGSGTISQSLPANTYNFMVQSNGTVSYQNSVSVSADMTIDFYTSAVTVNVSSACSAANVSGVNVKYSALGTWFNLGNTDGSGNVYGQLFPGTYTFMAQYRATTATQSVTVTGTGVVPGGSTSAAFHPTLVTNFNNGTLYYYSMGTLTAVNGTNYMFPGTYTFKSAANLNYQTNITISGCTQSFTANILILKDHNGNPLAGGHGRGGYGNNYGTWFAGSGAATDANGVLFDIINGNSAPSTMSYEMKYNNTTSVLTQDVSQPNGNIFNFKTIELRLRLETCGGTGLSGGTGRWGNGATFGTYFFPAPNSTDANGETAAEWFPGTYSFEMNYQSTSNVKSSVTIPNANSILTWQTTNVTLSWPYDIAYGGNGDSRFFNKPSMELLPGTVNFNFRSPNGNNYFPLTISGCSMAPTVGNVRLINSTGGPISGGSVDGYQGGWSHYGTTDANGNLLVLGKNPTSLAMTYVGGREQKNGINFSVTPVVTFQTKVVTMELKNSQGGALESDAKGLSYYAGGWKVFGTGNTSGGSATMEMLPVSYSFALVYKGGRQQINNQNVGTSPVVTFQTKEVTMELKDSHGGALESDAKGLSYYAGGWKTFGSGKTSGGSATMEMLPVSYSFALVYKGGRQQINNQNVGVTPVVTFQTKVANIYLVDGCGSPIQGGSTTYYAGGWYNLGTTDANGLATMELLPVSYSFRMAYNSKSNQQNGIAVPATMYFVYDGSSITYNGASAPTCNNQSRSATGAYEMEDQVITNEVRTFPNPASDQLRVTFGSPVSKSSEIKLIDLSGRTVVKQPIAVQQGQNTYMMSVGKLTNGVYMLMIGNSKISKNKVVVLHQ
ncbi:MAG: T9SS type A sorting domain-containing protein [Bacteroidetes bacterium]|nr:T9SS type A sorting domain-containing protein [Bacteroidota bacterium]MBS1631854.1 T9SS type A sorting domain-containing protein [Bacteroidota bacterium]